MVKHCKEHKLTMNFYLNSDATLMQWTEINGIKMMHVNNY